TRDSTLWFCSLLYLRLLLRQSIQQLRALTGQVLLHRRCIITLHCSNLPQHFDGEIQVEPTGRLPTLDKKIQLIRGCLSCFPLCPDVDSSIGQRVSMSTTGKRTLSHHWRINQHNQNLVRGVLEGHP